MIKISYSGYRFPPEIIQHAIWLYIRFTLSFRDVEDLLAERGIMVSYETVRRWVNHFGQAIPAYWSLKTVSNTLPFSPKMQIKFLTLLDVFFSIEASPSTTALISTSPILEFIFMTRTLSRSSSTSLIVGERCFKAMRPVALQAAISGASAFSEAAV
jgi:hypothetical protein